MSMSRHEGLNGCSPCRAGQVEQNRDITHKASLYEQGQYPCPSNTVLFQPPLKHKPMYILHHGSCAPPKILAPLPYLLVLIVGKLLPRQRFRQVPIPFPLPRCHIATPPKSMTLMPTASLPSWPPRSSFSSARCWALTHSAFCDASSNPDRPMTVFSKPAARRGLAAGLRVRRRERVRYPRR